MSLKKNSLSYQIYEELKNDILKNKLKLSEKISINEISNKYGVSHTPAREAIKNLIKDGLIVGSTNKVHKVISITEKELSEVLEIRKMCECYSVDKIIENMGPKEIKNINKQIMKLKSLDEEKNQTIRDFYSADIDFHQAIVGSVGNSKLMDIYQRISYIMNIIIYRINNREKISDVFFKQHIDILKSILERDNKKTKEMLKKHIEHSFKYYQDNFL